MAMQIVHGHGPQDTFHQKSVSSKEKINHLDVQLTTG